MVYYAMLLRSNTVIVLGYIIYRLSDIIYIFLLLMGIGYMRPYSGVYTVYTD